MSCSQSCVLAKFTLRFFAVIALLLLELAWTSPSNTTANLDAAFNATSSATTNTSSEIDFTLAKSRSKRGVIQLASMINCVVGCDPLAYKGYGCYCGYRGSGIPMDGIDRCCLQHDWCYTRSTCSQILLYVMPYQWSCVAPGYAQCGLPYFGTNDGCAFRLCECDRILAQCLGHYPCPDVKPSCKPLPPLVTFPLIG